MDYFKKLEIIDTLNNTSVNIRPILEKFFYSYKEAVESNGLTIENVYPLLNQFLDLVIQQLKTPYAFEPYHEVIDQPFDYYKFGLDFIKPLVKLDNSKIFHPENLNEIENLLEKGDNVILLANHQTEPDPQAISILIEKNHPKLAKEMIFVAGHRVTSDPLCVPFSMGRNLLCIYSKKHIKTPPELMEQKLLHNKRTMLRMKDLLSVGGKCIYVAPSGGRDRINEKGIIEIAKFDPQSIEMFLLMAKQSDKPTHFFPLALSTYDLLPPPGSVDKTLGEERHAKSTPIYLAFNKEIDMENFEGSQGLDKKEKREARAEHIWNVVKRDYHLFP